jgi:hypothetical protein
MNRKVLMGLWFGSLMLIVLVAGSSWIDVLLSPAAGGQLIQITGLSTFPIIGALALLQGASLLASAFTPALVSKSIVGIQIPVIAWHLVVVSSTAASALQQAISAEITKTTGVVGITSQGQLIEQALNTNLWYAYVAALALNLAVLISMIFAKDRPQKTKSQAAQAPDSGELWDSQG